MRTTLNLDRYLDPYRDALRARTERADLLERRLSQGAGSLAAFANAHEYYGLHRTPAHWVFRELAPNATALWLVGDFSDWERRPEFRAERIDDRGVWELRLPADALAHGQHYRLDMEWPGGGGERLPAFARRIVQDPATLRFTAQVWDPAPYVWKHDTACGVAKEPRFPLIYEAHVGMAQERPGVGTYREFTDNILPRIKAAGYGTVQLMALMEHPYYASFGYQVSNFFAPSSRFGTPEELKELVDTAHGMGLRVIMDLVHSHSVDNEYEGLSLFDGTPYLYFHDGPRGRHRTWGSRCFDYGRLATLHFLLSNCRYWLDEFHLDGFRFDGVTSMLYLHHGLGVDFVGYDQYFDGNVDEDALAYLMLANRLIHAVRPDALTVAEDVSGMPGLGASATKEGGVGFDRRLAMGVTECWTRLLTKQRDENWSMGGLWHDLTDHRADERAVSYAECHDQAMVGGKTLFFEMADAAIYDKMDLQSESLVIDRAVALHKMIRLATFATADAGYLNFMGNEFGHPEWIDFPRDGNGNSYAHARRQWSLRDDPALRFKALGDFDAAMLGLTRFAQVPSPKSQVLSPKSQVPSPKSQVLSPKSQVPSPRSRVPSPKSQVLSPKSQVLSPKSQVPSQTGELANSFANSHPRLLFADEAAKVLALFRGDLLFVFHFHGTESHEGYPVHVPPGRYELLLDTDRTDFGGQGRVAKGQEFPLVWETVGDEKVPTIRLYLPVRTALVLRREKIF